MSDAPDYAKIYRRLNPRKHPYSPYEPQRQLTDLWPSEQEKFKRMIDTILREPTHG